ncbi:hypothetical protein X011_01795 [Mycobacterium tuberculosis variant microti OV254]|nr:hypothetical protein X011_01795 [Mycobacterium tuberculosis variant microti OV254]
MDGQLVGFGQDAARLPVGQPDTGLRSRHYFEM